MGSSASQTKPRGSAAAFSTNAPQPWGSGGCLCACVCECVSVSLHACVSCVCACVSACVSLRACLCLHVCACVHACVCVPACLPVYVRVCLLFLCVHVGLRVSVHLCALRVYLISVCVCVRVAMVFLNYRRTTWGHHASPPSRPHSSAALRASCTLRLHAGRQQRLQATPAPPPWSPHLLERLFWLFLASFLCTLRRGGWVRVLQWCLLSSPALF